MHVPSRQISPGGHGALGLVLVEVEVVVVVDVDVEELGVVDVLVVDDELVEVEIEVDVLEVVEVVDDVVEVEDEVLVDVEVVVELTVLDVEVLAEVEVLEDVDVLVDVAVLEDVEVLVEVDVLLDVVTLGLVDVLLDDDVLLEVDVDELIVLDVLLELVTLDVVDDVLVEIELLVDEDVLVDDEALVVVVDVLVDEDVLVFVVDVLDVVLELELLVEVEVLELFDVVVELDVLELVDVDTLVDVDDVLVDVVLLLEELELDVEVELTDVVVELLVEVVTDVLVVVVPNGGGLSLTTVLLSTRSRATKRPSSVEPASEPRRALGAHRMPASCALRAISTSLPSTNRWISPRSRKEVNPGPRYAALPRRRSSDTATVAGSMKSTRQSRFTVREQKTYSPAESWSVELVLGLVSTTTSPYVPGGSASVVPASTVTGAPGLQAGKGAGKPQASARSGNGLVKDMGFLQPEPEPFTLLARSSRQTAAFATLTSSADTTDAGARNWPLAVSVPSGATVQTSPAATLVPSAPIRRSARSA
jgi:hypothetical protein